MPSGRGRRRGYGPLQFSLDLSHHPWTGPPDPARAASDTLALARARAADEGGIDAPADPRPVAAFLPAGRLRALVRHDGTDGGGVHDGDDRQGGVLLYDRPQPA